MKTAIDIVLFLVSEAVIKREEAKILLEAIYNNNCQSVCDPKIKPFYEWLYKDTFTTEPYKWDITCNNK